MGDTSTVQQLRKLCRKENLELVEKPNGHFQIKGQLLVNYWPNSAKQTCYVAGTTKGTKRCSPSEAIDLTRTCPDLDKKDARGRNSRVKRQRLINKGVTTCYWCQKPLTIDTSTLEHIIPLNRGGLENANNRTLACEDCNHGRGDNMPELKNG